MECKSKIKKIKEKIIFSRRLYWLLEADKVAIYYAVIFIFLTPILVQKYYGQEEISLEFTIIIITLFLAFCLSVLIAPKEYKYDKSFPTCEEETIEFMNVFNNAIEKNLDEKFPNIGISVFAINAFENKKITFALAKCEKYYKKGKIDKNLFKKTKAFYVEYFSNLFGEYENFLRESKVNQSKLQNRQMEISNILKE